MTLLAAVILVFGLFGHAAFWVALNNRLHAIGLHCRWVCALEKLIGVILLGLPLLLLWRHVEGVARFGLEGTWSSPVLTEGWGPIATPYFAAGSIFALQVIYDWLRRVGRQNRLPQFLRSSAVRHHVPQATGEPLVGDLKTRLLSWVPGNQMLELAEEHKELAPLGWPAALSGLTVVHLSDFHFTGGVKQAFFDYAVARANAAAADLAVITGDLIDEPACLEWIGRSLGKLQARHGVVAILGNHDCRRVRPQQVRAALAQCGILDVGGALRLLNLRGAQLLVAGNEMPWFGPPPNMSQAPPSPRQKGPPRLLLSHSPDQLPWARRHEFQVMLAGHTHGGQIRLPLIGPLVAPSLYGVKYASGVFYESPTLMHVTRGLAGLEPLRLNCPPELAVLRFTCAENL